MTATTVSPIEHGRILQDNRTLGAHLAHDVIRRPDDRRERVLTLVAMARRHPLMWCLELWHYPDGRAVEASPEERRATFERAAAVTP